MKEHDEKCALKGVLTRFSGSFLACMDRFRPVEKPLMVFNFSVASLILY
jgi:hypothetical protein